MPSLLTVPRDAPRIPPMPERPFAVYPLRFKEIYKDKIWGGPELAKVIGKKGASRRCGQERCDPASAAEVFARPDTRGDG